MTSLESARQLARAASDPHRTRQAIRAAAWRWGLAVTLSLAPMLAWAQGNVSAWGLAIDGQTTIPAAAGNFTAIGAGHLHSLVVRADGTVAAFGANTFGQSSVPAGLTGVRAVTGGLAHSLALRNDGTVVAWGDNSAGQASEPAGLTGEIGRAHV